MASSTNINYPTITSLLCHKYELTVAESINVVSKWLKQHPDYSRETLRRFINTGLVVIQDKTLVDMSRISLEEALEIAKELQSANGLEIKNRWYHFKCYKECFVGSELVDWLGENRSLSEKEAIALGQNLLEHKIIAHVCNDHTFKNDFLFYRFIRLVAK